MHFSLTTTRALQLLTGALDIGNALLAVNGVLPAHAIPYVIGALAVVHTLINEIAHNSTPDGDAIAAVMDATSSERSRGGVSAVPR